ncbi:MAG: phosphoribosylanthranilate isomerase [Chloroflexota bacterium]
MIVKICGLTDESAVLAAAAAGADLLGFVFAPSRRRLEPARARELIATARQAGAVPCPPKVVGVFVNEPAARVAEVAADCGLDWVQLNGDEDAAYVRRLGLPAIVARPVTRALDAAAVAAFLAVGALVLLDAYSPAQRGGSGSLCDWEMAAALATRFPVLLAGGLTPDNVAGAIAAVRPAGVDVSSGVEADGRKDPAKIAAFVRQVRLAAPAGRGECYLQRAGGHCSVT